MIEATELSPPATTKHSYWLDAAEAASHGVVLHVPTEVVSLGALRSQVANRTWSWRRTGQGAHLISRQLGDGQVWVGTPDAWRRWTS